MSSLLQVIVHIFLSNFINAKFNHESVQSGFFVGRISEGQFEYTDLNGWMTPRKAIDLCENDEKCGGFTYKGANLIDREYDIYFFHILINVETDTDSWKWIFYKPSKTYARFPGTFESEDDSENLQFVNEDVDGITPEEKCELDSECVAIVKTDDVPTAVLVDYLDIDNFKISEDKITLLKIKNVTKDTNIDATNAWDDIDTCCPKHRKTNTKELLKTINDTMPRISCDIPAEDFLDKYVRKREAVILVNCSKEWIAQTNWSLEKLLNEKGGKLKWRSDFESQSSSFKKFENVDDLSGNLLNEIIDNNGTIRIFDPIGRRKHTFKRRNGTKLETDKMYLFSQYEKPKPVPRDYYEMSGLLTDYQWIIISHKDTGTELHTDPDYTSPWNTVLSGHKWWVLMPPEVLPDSFLCDEKCSQIKEDDINVNSWFTHVLPQLRGRKWYGSTVTEFIQGPGETIYMPGNLAHAIMNIDENVSVTENYFLVDSLDDWVHGMMTGENLIDDESDGLEEEIFWRAMYFRHLGREDREVIRAMRDQVEYMVNYDGSACEESDSDDEEEDNVGSSEELED